MTKAELHELVDRLPDGAVDGAAILLEEISDGRIAMDAGASILACASSACKAILAYGDDLGIGTANVRVRRRGSAR